MKKGFTLVELIAVVAILGVIATIAGISYTTINNNHKKQSCENLESLLETSAIEYVQDNNLLHFPKNDQTTCGCIVDTYCMCVSYNELLTNGYVEEDLENVKGSLANVKIKVTYNNSYNAAVYGGLCN